MPAKPLKTSAEEQVDLYIASAAPFARPICRKLRALIRKADPSLAEEWKWGAPVYSKKGLVCSIGAFKKHAAIWFYKGALLADPKRLFEKTMAAGMRSI